MSIQREDSPDQSTERPASEAELESLLFEVLRIFKRGDLEQAVAVQRQIVSLCETLAGKEHWRTKSERSRLREWEYVEGLTPEQRQTYLDAYTSLSEGLWRLKSEDYAGAEDELSKALAGFTATVGEDFMCTSSATQGLGAVNLDTGNPVKAKEYYLRTVAIRKINLGEDHIDYPYRLVDAASACLETKEFDEAERLIRDALSRFRKDPGVKSVAYAEGLEKLSLVMIGEKRLPEAESLCLQAIPIAEKQQETGLLASCLLDLAEVNLAFGESAEAEYNLRRSEALRHKDPPRKGAEAVKLLDRYGALFRKAGCPDEAKMMETTAESFRERLRSKAHGRKDPAR